MFAVVKTGGKQYVVEVGDILEIEKISGEKGETVKFDSLLLSDDTKTEIGTPVLSKAKVAGEIIDQFKDDKVEVMKFKKKTGYRRKKGHRQQLTKVRITTISW